MRVVPYNKRRQYTDANMLKVLVLHLYDSTIASCRFRAEQWAEPFREKKIELEIVPFFDGQTVARSLEGKGYAWSFIFRATLLRLKWLVSARKYDCVWIYQEVLPYLPDHWILKLLGIRFVHDVDDAYYLKHSRSKNLFFRYVVSRKWKFYAKNAIATFAGSPALEEYFRSFGAKNVVTAPTVVSTNQYLPNTEIPTRSRPVVGWIGSPTTAPFLKTVSRALSDFQKKTGAEIVVIGAAEGFTLEGCSIRPLRWSKNDEIAMIQSFDIGIMPLPDDEWSRAKCGFKLIQYMACGIPSIASPVGANLDIIRDGVDGLFAATQDEWLQALIRLAEDPEIRRKMAESARERAVAHYSLETWAPKLAGELLNRVDKSATRK